MIIKSCMNDTIPPSGITKVILNDKVTTPAYQKSIISTLSNREILIRKNGYIFSSSIREDCLCLGILPYFIEGERTHHYDIDLSVKGKCILFGFINSNETIAILFKPDKETYNNGFLPGIVDVFRDNYIRLARFLINYGFAENFELDLATRNIMEESKLFTETPLTVRELALQPAPFDLYGPNYYSI